MASYRSEHERPQHHGIPPLDELEAGRPIGAILAMTEHEQVAVLEGIELVDFLLNQEDVTWS